MLFVSRYKEEREEQCIEMCKSERVTGVVLCSGSFETEKFEDLDFPLITLERSMDEGTSGIECDNYQISARLHFVISVRIEMKKMWLW